MAQLIFTVRQSTSRPLRDSTAKLVERRTFYIKRSKICNKYPFYSSKRLCIHPPGPLYCASIFSSYPCCWIFKSFWGPNGAEQTKQKKRKQITKQSQGRTRSRYRTGIDVLYTGCKEDLNKCQLWQMFRIYSEQENFLVAEEPRRENSQVKRQFCCKIRL